MTPLKGLLGGWLHGEANGKELMEEKPCSGPAGSTAWVEWGGEAGTVITAGRSWALDSCPLSMTDLLVSYPRWPLGKSTGDPFCFHRETLNIGGARLTPRTAMVNPWPHPAVTTEI